MSNFVVVKSDDFMEKTAASFHRGVFQQVPYFLLPEKGGWFGIKMNTITFEEYKPVITLLDKEEEWQTLLGHAHSAGTMLTAGVVAGVAGVIPAVLALAAAGTTAPKKDVYRFMSVVLNDGRSAILRASPSAFKKIEPYTFPKK